MLEEERWVTCPKNEGHRLKLKHLNRHLWRCRGEETYQNLSYNHHDYNEFCDSSHSSNDHLPQQSTPQPPPQQSSTPQPPQQSSELSHSGNGTLTGSSRRNFF
jgi:hypothetical protein